MRLLLNASNLHAGGGVAVAASVINELSQMARSDVEITIVASSDVHRNLVDLDTDTSVFHEFCVFETSGVEALWTCHPYRAREFDVILTVFGPCYHISWAFRSVMGFAQPWVAFPRNAAYQLLSPKQRRKNRWRFAAMVPWFLLADTLVVEQQAIKAALQARRSFQSKRIAVVESAVDSVYTDPSRWQPVEFPPRSDALRLGVVARNYPHKNLAILPRVKRVLQDVHNLSTEIFVTLNHDEWAATSEEFKREITNIGALSLAQCPSFNSQLDAVVFPTLLECYSATPIEARTVGTTLFASDLSVIRDTVGDYAHYFDPLDPYDIANKIVSVFTPNKAAAPNPTSLSRNHSRSKDRAVELLDLCRGIHARRTSQRSQRWRTRSLTQ